MDGGKTRAVCVDRKHRAGAGDAPRPGKGSHNRATTGVVNPIEDFVRQDETGFRIDVLGVTQICKSMKVREAGAIGLHGEHDPISPTATN